MCRFIILIIFYSSIARNSHFSCIHQSTRLISSIHKFQFRYWLRYSQTRFTLSCILKFTYYLFKLRLFTLKTFSCGFSQLSMRFHQLIFILSFLLCKKINISVRIVQVLLWVIKNEIPFLLRRGLHIYQSLKSINPCTWKQLIFYFNLATLILTTVMNRFAIFAIKITKRLFLLIHILTFVVRTAWISIISVRF